MHFLYFCAFVKRREIFFQCSAVIYFVMFLSNVSNSLRTCQTFPSSFIFSIFLFSLMVLVGTFRHVPLLHFRVRADLFIYVRSPKRGLALCAKRICCIYLNSVKIKKIKKKPSVYQLNNHCDLI